MLENVAQMFSSYRWGRGGMIQSANHERQTAFSGWLRTGRLPRISNPDVVEFKFNHWHDPADGRFTFAGSGRDYGRSDGNGASSGGRSDSGGSLRHDRQEHRNFEIQKITISHAQFQRPIPKARLHVQQRRRRELPSQTPTPRMARLVRDSHVVAAVASGVAGPHWASPGLMIPKNSGRCQAIP